MKKNITELKLNPINPRTITEENMERLILSVLLFPKMLSLRDIIINKDNVVLSGNQRLKALTSISTMDETKLDESLAKSSRFQNLAPNDEQQIKNYWKKWQEDPTVDVTIADTITPEEEKELLIKDNKEFGYFDMEAMKSIYDADTLAEFGLDVEEPIIDPDDDYQTGTSTPPTGQPDGPIYAEILRFGRNRVPVTESEYATLELLWNEYVESTGRFDGFITHILDKKESKE